jgi:hypothetical protein
VSCALYIENASLTTDRTLDLFMLVTVNAREREADDWEALFTEADPRYKFLGVTLPPKARLWLIEAEWDPERAVGVEGE